MKMQKMLLVGAMFMTLVNVNTVSAWANPLRAKTAGVRHITQPRYRVVNTGDDGCPGMSSHDTAQRGGDLENPSTEQPDPNGGNFGKEPPPKTPCEKATEETAKYDKEKERLDGLARTAEDTASTDRDAYFDAKDDPLKTQAQKDRLFFIFQKSGELAEDAQGLATVAATVARSAKSYEEMVCGGPVPELNDPFAPPGIERILEESYVEELSGGSS